MICIVMSRVSFGSIVLINHVQYTLRIYDILVSYASNYNYYSQRVTNFPDDAKTFRQR